MRKIIFTFFLFAILGVTAESILACSCELLPETKPFDSVVRNAYIKSSAVFVGEAIEVNRDPKVLFVEVKFKIKQKWDDKIGNTLTIITGTGGGDCGYSFEVGKEYLVYAHKGKDNLTTNICTRTALADKNKDIDALNRMKKRKIKSSPK